MSSANPTAKLCSRVKESHHEKMKEVEAAEEDCHRNFDGLACF